MKTTSEELSKILKIPKSRSQEAIIKAKLIDGILKELQKSKMTHAELAKNSSIPRSAITGILSGSLQKVTLDRLLRIVEALGLVAEVRLRKVTR
jgi:predicted XRE-type DNA-binding protein